MKENSKNLIHITEDISKKMDSIISSRNAFKLRRRLNTHHPAAQVRDELISFNKYINHTWFEAKNTYLSNREGINKIRYHLSKKVRENLKIMEKIVDSEIDGLILGDEDEQ